MVCKAFYEALVAVFASTSCDCRTSPSYVFPPVYQPSLNFKCLPPLLFAAMLLALLRIPCTVLDCLFTIHLAPAYWQSPSLLTPEHC